VLKQQWSCLIGTKIHKKRKRESTLATEKGRIKGAQSERLLIKQDWGNNLLRRDQEEKNARRIKAFMVKATTEKTLYSKHGTKRLKKLHVNGLGHSISSDGIQ